jgi:hypothetical protein
MNKFQRQGNCVLEYVNFRGRVKMDEIWVAWKLLEYLQQIDKVVFEHFPYVFLLFSNILPVSPSLNPALAFEVLLDWHTDNMFFIISRFITLLMTFVSNTSSIKIFPSPAALPSSMPAACRASLSSNIVCGPTLVLPQDIERDIPLNDAFLTEYCNSTCSTSVQTWTAAVNTRCSNTRYAFPGNVSWSGGEFAIPFQWAYNSVCTKGGLASEFCYPDALNQTLKACDDCALKYFASMLNSTYGIRKISETRFKSLLSSCAVSPTKYPYSTVSGVTPPAAT